MPTSLEQELTGTSGQAAELGAKVVFLSEITLIRYPADVRASETPVPQPKIC